MPMISVKQAIKTASEFLGEIFPDKAKDLRLEEVELDEGGKWWHVTLSFSGRDVSILGAAFPGQREYKTVEVDAYSGEPRAVKIRVLNA